MEKWCLDTKELRDVPDLNPKADNVVRREKHVSRGSSTYAEALAGDAAETKEPVGILEV